MPPACLRLAVRLAFSLPPACLQCAFGLPFGLPPGLPFGLSPACLRLAFGLPCPACLFGKPSACLRLAFGLHSACLRFAFGVPPVCLLFAFGLPSACPPLAFGLPPAWLRLGWCARACCCLVVRGCAVGLVVIVGPVCFALIQCASLRSGAPRFASACFVSLRFTLLCRGPLRFWFGLLRFSSHCFALPRVASLPFASLCFALPFLLCLLYACARSETVDAIPLRRGRS